ncbi:tetraacyldisaccharide 4'-kinase [Ramlibacter albus]|uniref:Tetraacyldisaccharide 4'-kinase n=1 Tax=Ramlibacter albus TaxID=2079448 RepID=A0A923M6C7_9BURK|nr:tetraacyldisaccharide 4'-kinase [Ramlibacter albus]MBC5764626.1 tetraacyldisaccharide 4'-kinase [Ramlibacter albus]
MSKALQQAWWSGGLLAWLLWPFSLVFALLAGVRRVLYALRLLPSYRAPVPVVVVGNLVVGGAGKTPVVIAVVEHLLARGLQPGVVARGYGREATDCREVMLTSAPSDVGDEPLLVKRRTAVPVFVSSNRGEAARALLKAHPEVNIIVSDDGLQHYALRRDVEVCVVDERGAGNGFRLPAGPLRESASRRVDLKLGGDGHRVRRTLAPYAERADEYRIPLGDLKLQGKPVKAIAGVASPQTFFDMLRAQGVQCAATEALPDHFDFAQILPPEEASFTIVCTEKDAVKLWRQRPDAWAVPLQVEIDGAFFALLDRLLDAKLSSKHGPQAA